MALSDWRKIRTGLEQRFPDATEGILFCVHKLAADHELTLPDLRDEAAALGIKLGGRSLHSARVLLGTQEKTAQRTVVRNGTRTARSLEDQLVTAVTELQSQATADSRRLRTAIAAAIRVLQEALET